MSILASDVVPPSATCGWEALPPVLTMKEAAAVLRIGVRQLNERCLTGEIPSFKSGRSRRIETDALRDYVRRRSTSQGE